MHDSVVCPQKFIAYLKSSGRLRHSRPPKTVVFVFLESIVATCRQERQLTKLEGFDTGELYVVGGDDACVGIYYCRGIGAPAAVINLEELIAFGVERFVVLGTAGSLQSELRVGEVVLCNSAYADEGTSKHYGRDAELVRPELAWHARLATYLAASGVHCRHGASWTTDAPYRETREKVLAYRSCGALAVEMEMSALFTVANFHQVSLAAVLVISDSLADLTWTPGFFSSSVSAALQQVTRAVLKFAEVSSGQESKP